jgi:hypothetical protein
MIVIIAIVLNICIIASGQTNMQWLDASCTTQLFKATYFVSGKCAYYSPTTSSIYSCADGTWRTTYFNGLTCSGAPTLVTTVALGGCVYDQGAGGVYIKNTCGTGIPQTTKVTYRTENYDPSNTACSGDFSSVMGLPKMLEN